MANEYSRFEYQPTGTGVISGRSTLKQTEDAINNMGESVYQAETDSAAALALARRAIADSEQAINDASEARGAAEAAQTTANTANATANAASNAATAAETKADNAVSNNIIKKNDSDCHSCGSCILNIIKTEKTLKHAECKCSKNSPFCSVFKRNNYQRKHRADGYSPAHNKIDFKQT